MTGRNDPKRYFRLEARELVDELSRGLVAIDRGEEDAGALDRLFRQAHTLKGAANVVGEEEIAEHARTIEDILDAHREAREPVTPAAAQELMRVVEAIEGALAKGAPAPEAGPEPRPAGGIEPEQGVDGVRVDLGELDALAEPLASANVHAARIGSALSEVDAIVREVLEGASGPGAPSGAVGDRLARLRHSMAERLDALVADLDGARERVEHLRLVPAASMAPLLERAARTAAASVEKRVRFELEGGEVRLDRRVVPAVREALLHMVRNAVDHGIETPDHRREAGKPDEGLVRISASRRGRLVALACEDDGRGVDVDAVRRAAVERGAISADEAAGLDTAATHRLLFRHRLSTRDRVTDLSGRGVGMDVVRAAADRLRGEASIESRLGAGTTVTLVVPVSMTTTLAVEAVDGPAIALVSVDALVEAKQIEEGEILVGASGSDLSYGGGLVPYARLAAVLEDAGAERPVRARAALILRHADGQVAVGIERVLGVREVLVRPLPWAAGARDVVLGVSLDLGGAPRLVLDPQAVGRAVPRLGAAAGARSVEAGQAAAKRRILVIDDSLTTRMLEQTILEMAGYDVDLATSAEEGLGMARARPYALFVVDVEMPGMNGFEFAKTTRADAELRETPVVLVTSLASDADRARGREAGAAAHIAKGEFHQGRFLALVRELAR